ncbi:MBL fold metallo-hydrolase [Thalassotalea montiporae]
MLKKLSLILLAATTSFTVSARDFSDVKIETSKAAGDVYMLTGPGGNIGVLATGEGLLLVDDKFAPLAEKIENAMKAIVDQDLKYVINTHYHGDHTGSNSYFSHKAPIFAHHNVRNRLKSNDRLTKDALPVVTYDKGVTIHLANEEVQLTHLPKGHTDSDTIVYFKNANVLHTGDLFFEGRFPYVDTNGGGSVDGYIANVSYMVNNFPDDVVIIPGHGNLTDKAGMKEFVAMMIDTSKQVKAQLRAGKSEADILKAGVAQEYKALSWNFITEERWLKTLIAAYK